MFNKFIGAACACLTVIATANPGMAAPLTYTPINPSFGGSPLNSSHLMGTASAQRKITAWDSGLEDSSNSGATPQTTDAEQFVRQLQGRLLSALASQVSEAIFGENPRDNGTVQFGDTKVSFERSLDSIRLVIEDANGITEIVVPQLVVR